MSDLSNYDRWKSNPLLPNNLLDELKSIEGHPDEIKDRFAQDLEFGTGGLRGKMGAGTNRMNLVTVGKATQGLAQYLLKQRADQPGTNRPVSVVIAHDSRHMSPEFTKHSALVLAANGIKAYVFDSLRPTPMLSFAVRYLAADGGIVITASHNPPEYNGYKVYGSDGGQILEDAANGILEQIRGISDEFAVKALSEEQARGNGLLETLGPEVDQVYITELKKMLISNLSTDARDSLRIVYTPLHGTGNIPVRTILREAGYSQVHVVPEQEKPDPNFSTVSSPNPEEPQAFQLAIELAKETEADLIMGTDPDCDRVGVVARNQQGDYTVLTGNETGGLLLDFILQRLHEAGTVPPNGLVLKTIVTSELGRVIADEYQLQTEDTLTGFKYIADKIGHYEATGEKQFLFGYEESYGYLLAPFVRDKDAVQACLMISEMAAYYRMKGMTLYDALLQLFERIGYFREALESLTLPGQEGLQRIKSTMQQLREQPPELAGMKLVQVEDYLTQTRRRIEDGSTERLNLPVSDVLKYFYEDQSWVAIRPSGTEPKIKLYIGVKADNLAEAEQKLEMLKQECKALLQ